MSVRIGVFDRVISYIRVTIPGLGNICAWDDRVGLGKVVKIIVIPTCVIKVQTDSAFVALTGVFVLGVQITGRIARPAPGGGEHLRGDRSAGIGADG